MFRIICSFIIVALIVGQIGWLIVGEKGALPQAKLKSDGTLGVAQATIARDQSRKLAPVPGYVGESSSGVSDSLSIDSAPGPEPSLPAERPTVPSLVADLVRSGIVEVALPTQGSVGTGFIARINQDGFDVVTAAHILNNRSLGTALPSIEVTSYFGSQDQKSDTSNSVDHGRLHRVVWLKEKDAANDVALLRVVSRDVPEEPMSMAAPSGHDGASAAALTPFYAWQVRWNAAQKPVPESVEVLRRTTAQRHDKSPTTDFLVCRPASDPGMSGGPLLDGDGRVLGIASGNSSGQAYYVHAKPIVDLLQRTKVDESK